MSALSEKSQTVMRPAVPHTDPVPGYPVHCDGHWCLFSSIIIEKFLEVSLLEPRPWNPSLATVSLIWVLKRRLCSLNSTWTTLQHTFQRKWGLRAGKRHHQTVAMTIDKGRRCGGFAAQSQVIDKYRQHINGKDLVVLKTRDCSHDLFKTASETIVNWINVSVQAVWSESQ